MMMIINPLRQIRTALPGQNWTRLQQPHQEHPVLQVHAASVSVSVIHRTLTWTATWSLTWVCDRSYACIIIQTVVGHTDSESTKYYCWLGKNSQVFLMLLAGFELGSWNPLDLESDGPPMEPATPSAGSVLAIDHPMRLRQWLAKQSPMFWLAAWLSLPFLFRLFVEQWRNRWTEETLHQ